MFRLELLFLMQIVMGILMIIFLHKIIQIKKQVDHITKEVRNYIAFVTEDLEKEEIQLEETVNLQKDHLDKTQRKSMGKKEREEAQNSLIQAVLGEYFP